MYYNVAAFVWNILENIEPSCYRIIWKYMDIWTHTHKYFCQLHIRSHILRERERNDILKLK